VTDSSPEPTTPAPPTHLHDVPDTSPPPSDAVDPDAVDPDAVDLDAVERDLAAVEVALERLSEGTYWTDEVTGQPIAEHVLAADPTARRA
jgi:RNA polymerase-binding transcription factor DksA